MRIFINAIVPGNEPARRVSRQQKEKTKQKNAKYERLFMENRHLFDMSCDNCTKVFDSLEGARTHYATEHNNPKGYIKCCESKLIYRCHIVQHLARHLEPDKFKYVHDCHFPIESLGYSIFFTHFFAGAPNARDRINFSMCSSYT